MVLHSLYKVNMQIDKIQNKVAAPGVAREFGQCRKNDLPTILPTNGHKKRHYLALFSIPFEKEKSLGIK